jgi:cell division septum initiation protein DivIVA
MVPDEQFGVLKEKLVTNLQSALAALETIPGEESTILQARIREMLDAAAGAATPEELQPVLDAVKTGLAPIVDAGAAPVQALIAQIDDTLANGENLTTERVQAIVDAANAEIEKLPDQGKESGDQWVQNLIASTSKLNEVNQLVEQNLGGIGDTVQGSMDTTQSAVETAQGAVETATSAIGSAFSEFGDNANKALDGAKSDVDTFVTDATSSIDGLKSTVSESGIWQGFTSQLDSATTSAKYLGGEFLEFEGILARIGGKGLDAAASNIQKSMGDIQKTVEGAATDVGTAFDQIGTELSTSGAASGMATLEANWNTSLENIKKTTQDAATDVGTAFDQIGTELSTSGAASGIATLGDNWNTSIENIKLTTQGAVADIGTAFDQIGTELSTSGLAAALAQGGENLKTSWTNIQGTFQEVADSIPGTLASAGEGIQSSLNSFTGFIADWVGKIPDVLGGLQDALLQALVQPWINIYFNIKNALLEISGASLIDDWFANLITNMGKWASDAMSAALDAFTNGFTNWTTSISGALDGIKETLDEAIYRAFAAIRELWQDTLAPALEKIPELIGTKLTEITGKVTEWANDLLNVLKTTLSPENIGSIISDAFSGMKDKVMEFLHQLHGSGEVEPWLEDLHDTMVEGLEKTVTDSVDAFSGIADAVGDELGAASEEITTFVASLSEATNEVQTDMSNIIATARSGGASISRFQGLQLAYGDTGPGGGGGGGGGGQQDQRRVDQEVEAADRAARDVHDTMNQFINTDIARANDKAQQTNVAANFGPDQSPALFAANQQLDSAARNVKDAGKSMEDLIRESNAAERKNFENIMKGISSGQAAWANAAKDTSSGIAAWTGAAKDVTSAVKDVANTTAGGAPLPPPVEAPPSPPKQTAEEEERLRKVLAAGGDKTDFSVNVGTINVQNGEAIDFMQTYVDQYASLLNPGAAL